MKVKMIFGRSFGINTKLIIVGSTSIVSDDWGKRWSEENGADRFATGVETNLSDEELAAKEEWFKDCCDESSIREYTWEGWVEFIDPSDGIRHSLEGVLMGS